MRHQNLLQNDRAALVIIDVQERFSQHISNFGPMVRNIVRLINGCKILNVPIFVTEQYPKGLGPTISEIKSALADYKPLEKTAFTCFGEEFARTVRTSGRQQLIICGIEAHVCVNQSVHDLLAANYSVHIVEDAISSRDLNNKEIALRKMALAGAIPSSTEMALLELVGDSAAPSFKAVQDLIR